MKNSLLIIALVCLISACAPVGAEDAKVLFLAGPDSHKWGMHEHHADARVLAKALNNSGLGISAVVFEDSWPDDESAFEGVKAVVVCCDGQKHHLLNGHAEEMAALSEKGVGLVAIHYALEATEDGLQEKFLDWIGGYFEVNWSVNPAWLAKDLLLGEHPTTRGVKAFELEDEWHYHMRFRPGMKGVTPVLSALPPMDSLAEKDGPRNGNPALREELKQGKLQHLAWAAVNEHGGRGFGFTGAHFHKNWSHDDFRKLVLNGIVWAAGLEVPKKGVSSEKPVIVQNETLLKALGKGDAEDVERHILLGADVKETNTSGWTFLHYAAVRNQVAVGEVLIEHGSDVNALSNTKNAPIHICAERGFPEFARLLIKHGADMSLGDNAGWTTLHIAAANNKLDMIKLLVEEGANVNALSNLGGTALHEGAASAGKEVIQFLLDSGVDKSVVSSTGKSALDIAVEFENAAAAEALND